MALKISLIPATIEIRSMSPAATTLHDRIFSTYPSDSNRSLIDLCDGLFLEQQASWPDLRNGYEALKEVRLREIIVDGYSVVLQFNPRRIVSSEARVDPASVQQRPCFLCLDNLPQAEKGILYRDRFLVLCNPVPIVERHLTVANIEHIPQWVEGFVPSLLVLARDLSPAFSVLYNGPRSGASAPDHMHFQVCPVGSIPIERELGQDSNRDGRRSIDSVLVSCLTNVGRQAIILESAHEAEIGSVLGRLFLVMKQIAGSEVEPMINIHCSFGNEHWRVVVFPRRKHRPDVYFKEGKERIVISPATIDIGGLIVTPMERDFNRVDAAMVQTIYNEVLLDKATVQTIVSSL